MEPQNENVLLTIKQGLRNVTLLHNKMPRDCRTWCILFHNEFHRGSGTNFIQKFDAIEEIFATWQGFPREAETSLVPGNIPRSARVAPTPAAVHRLGVVSILADLGMYPSTLGFARKALPPGFCMTREITQRTPRYSTLLLDWANKTYEGRFQCVFGLVWSPSRVAL